MIPEGLYTCEVAERLSLNCYIHIGGDDITIEPYKSPIHKENAKKVLSRVAGIISVCQFLLDEIKPIFEGKEKDLMTLPRNQVVLNGVDLKKFSANMYTSMEERALCRAELGFEPKDMVILNVGQEIELKGWKELLIACANIIQNGYRLKILVIAPPPQEVNLAEMAETLGIVDALTHIKGVPPNKLNTYFGLADIFLFTFAPRRDCKCIDGSNGSWSALYHYQSRRAF